MIRLRFYIISKNASSDLFSEHPRRGFVVLICLIVSHVNLAPVGKEVPAMFFFKKLLFFSS